MFGVLSSYTRRAFLAASAAVGVAILLPAHLTAAAEDSTIRPFRVNVPQAALDDLRRRIQATRWPDKETVADRRRVCRWPRCRSWFSTGAAAMTGAR
jgi:hypothetical protein